MKCLRPLLFSAVCIWLAAGFTGCFPGGDDHLDEEKDPHFQRGRDLVDSQDYKGAVDEFEKALETNPRSAAAHYELGWLYDTKINDFAAAIYHYQRHLQLDPNSPRAALVRERIRGCKLELAGTEFVPPGTQNLQREVDRLTDENRLLKQQLDAARSRAASVAVAAPATFQTARTPLIAPYAAGVATRPRGAGTASAAEGHSRVYVVQARDTMASIATRYGLKVNAVLAANPNINPNRMRIGTDLTLP